MVASASETTGRLTVYVTSAAGSSIDSLLLQARYERAIIGLHPERRCRSASIDCFETFSGRFQVRFALMKPGAKPFQITSLRAFAVLFGQII
jgi:hypothetical protein